MRRAKAIDSRKPLRPLSQRNRAEIEARKAVFLAVLLRDEHCQLRDHGTCFGHLTPHHRRKASQGGGYTPENLVVLCAGCNDRIESDADFAALARSLGLVVRRGDPGYHHLGQPVG